MDAVDPVTTAEEEYDENEEMPPVRLRTGIELQDLVDSSSVVFQVNTDDFPDKEEDSFVKYFDDETALKCSNFDCLDVDDTDGGVDLGAHVTIHYNAYVEYGDDPYDSTRLRDSPQRLKLNGGGMIPGLDIAIATMKQGETSRFLIHPDLGYGKCGCPPRIPPTTCLRKLYKKAVHSLEKCHLKDEEEEKQQRKTLLKLYVNLAVCYNKQVNPKMACIIFGRALIVLSDYREAQRRLLAAKKLEPNNKEITEELKRLIRITHGPLLVYSNLAVIVKLEKKKLCYSDGEKMFLKRAFNSKKSETEEDSASKPRSKS
ncbi:hypothetical protein C0J52_05298 [Blattella germanica]|nr:hypothetical protein C0J52_05298 [Blattella germanica]